MTDCGTVGFIVRVSAFQTSRGLPARPKWRRKASHRPRRAYGELAHSSIALGMVAIAGRRAAMISASGLAESSERQNAISSHSAAIRV